MRRWSMFLVIAVVLSACGTVAAPTPDQRVTAGERDDEAQLVRADLDRIARPAADEQQVTALIDGTQDFAFKLYHAIPTTRSDNLLFSPHSIAEAFSMLYAGARGETEAQMADVLGYLPQAAQHPAFNALDQQLSALDQQPNHPGVGGDAFQLTVANAVWGQQGLPFQEPYLHTLAQHYGAGLQAVDFWQRPDAARGAINGWVAEQTKERIVELMPPGSVTADTRVVLANAVYFKASWLYPFPENETHDGVFMTLAGEQVTVPLMHDRAKRIPYVEHAEYQAVLLPYMGRTAEMLLLVPRAGIFEAVEQQLSAELWWLLCASRRLTTMWRSRCRVSMSRPASI